MFQLIILKECISFAKTPFCGSCGSKIDSFVSCPWCNAANDVENSFCCYCGKKIAYEPFRYTKNATTYEKMLKEVLKANTGIEENWIKRFTSNMQFRNDCQCSICGEINEVASIKQRELLSFYEDLKFTFGEAIIQTLDAPPGTKFNGVEENCRSRIEEGLSCVWECMVTNRCML
jgi:hypothetical protein